MSSNKKSLLRTVFTANGSCGCSKTKSSEVHEPIPKFKIPNTHHQKTNMIHNLSSMASSITSLERNSGISVNEEEEDFTSTTLSVFDTTTFHYDKNNNNDVVLKRSPLVDSVAIEKDSSNPYHDFRHSMLQMIFEKEIESENDLEDLLRCFLQLNAPCHHHVIVKAFNEICEEAFPCKVTSTLTPRSSQPSPSRKNDAVVPKSQFNVAM
ncbi:hypothetical protein RJT34_31030 [Clitoria ternatea]|uniref:Transcription repressor n=1 Tax=Clitoria ternatea TaxID=43366 RepID=A0AAN9I4M3_CLITE